jgi:hypothetical protein
MTEIDSLMKEVARAVQADARRKELLPAVKARLAALELMGPERLAARASNGRRWAWRLGAVGGLACAAAMALVVVRTRPISYNVAHSGDATALRFSDGSQVGLPAQAEARVDAVDENGATLAIAHGTIDVSVVHRARTRWSVRAGDYEIRVTGTKFAARWNPDKRILTVGMREGSVLVTGPGIREPMRVVGGQRLRATVHGADVVDVPAGGDIGDERDSDGATQATAPAAMAPAPPPVAAAPGPELQPAAPVAPAPAAPVHATREERSAPAARPHRSSPAPAAPSAPTLLAQADSNWRVQAARAQYRAALDAAVREGWRGDCDRLGSEDVILLGDVARLAGDATHAEEAYQTARRRFPSADRPVYGLGLIAFEVRRDYAASSRWFEAYLRSFPRGPLAREAGGRLLESRLKAGEYGAARDAASSYLRAYPDGPHAALARQTLGAPH